MASDDVSLLVRVCSRCNQEKPATKEFFPSDGNRLRRCCKQCRAEQKRTARHHNETPERRERRLAKAREYQAKNAESLSARKRAYRLANRERLSRYYRSRYLEKREEVKERARNWRIDNIERKRAANREWALANPEKALESGRRYKAKKRSDPAVRLSDALSAGIRQSINRGKDGRGWECVVGYSRAELQAHIERQFQHGMTWANYGEWHIDHIIPIASFSFSSPDDEEFRACWALTNLRPLWGKDNIRKRDRRTLLL